MATKLTPAILLALSFTPAFPNAKVLSARTSDVFFNQRTDANNPLEPPNQGVTHSTEAFDAVYRGEDKQSPVSNTESTANDEVPIAEPEEVTAVENTKVLDDKGHSPRPHYAEPYFRQLRHPLAPLGAKHHGRKLSGEEEGWRYSELPLEEYHAICTASATPMT
jgi:hypothetical protein